MSYEVRYAGYVEGCRQTTSVTYDDQDQATITREMLETLLANQTRPFTIDDDD